MTKDLYELGEVPDLGHVPPTMLAQVIRQARFGEPKDAFQREVVPTPSIGPRDVLVYVMAAGVNYNNVWAAMGIPIDVIKTRQKKGEQEAFHVGGSDASGIVWQVGPEVTSVKVGDEVVVHCGMWDPKDPHVLAGKDPAIAPSQHIWGYESNWGSFAQFCKVQDHQCLPKPPQLTWEAAAAYTLVGATAYRMLHGWQGNTVQPGDPVLIWGGAGGLGSMAIQIVKAAGGRAIAVVSGDDKVEYCKKLGAVGVIDRRRFDHWGKLPRWSDDLEYGVWLKGARAFGAAFWEALGEKRSPAIVFEHPGESTLPTSCFMCDTGGMIVICAGTTGYNATLDLRYHWMRQKRFQGSHFANDAQSAGFNDLVIRGLADPCLSRTFSFDDTGACHQLMRDNLHPSGNMSILVNSPKPGLITVDDVRSAR
jgi:crotonyl-CoA carboxylase/reductase